jgi:glycosyltransferase involved in cell wall biosynthesis
MGELAQTLPGDTDLTRMLSFLIPAYNCEKVLDEAIESALAQALGIEMEVIVVDDASTDSTAQCARAWEIRSPGLVKVGFHERNRGGAATRNTAAELARGELLYILDSDNVLPNGCVASQLETMTETGLDAISVGQMYFFEDSTTRVDDGWVLRHADGRSTLRHLFETNKVPPSHGNYLYTRHLFDSVGGYSVNAGATDTWTFGLKHLARGFEIGVDTRSHYFHRVDRANNDSYWLREERLGTNDVNVIRALREDVERLPRDLRELVETLKSDDRFFTLVGAGAFQLDPTRFREIRRRERARHMAHAVAHRMLAVATRMRGGRA